MHKCECTFSQHTHPYIHSYTVTQHTHIINLGKLRPICVNKLPFIIRYGKQELSKSIPQLQLSIMYKYAIKNLVIFIMELYWSNNNIR